jgi:hypothetical protein
LRILWWRRTLADVVLEAFASDSLGLWEVTVGSKCSFFSLIVEVGEEEEGEGEGVVAFAV